MPRARTPLADSLCASDDPVVAFRARRLLAAEPEHTPAMRKLRAAIRSSTMARRLLLGLRGERFNPYRKWQGPHWTLYSLAEIGYPPGDQRLLPVRQRVLDWMFAPAFGKPPGTAFLPGQPQRPRRCASMEGNTMRVGISSALLAPPHRIPGCPIIWVSTWPPYPGSGGALLGADHRGKVPCDPADRAPAHAAGQVGPGRRHSSLYTRSVVTGISPRRNVMRGRQSLSTGRFGLAVTLLAIALGLGGGCGSSAPSTSGCEVNGQYDRVVGMDDTTLGYSALDVVNAFAANGDGLLHWFDGTETILHITTTVSQGKGSNVTINASPSDPKYCAPSMSIEPVSFTVSTADGRLVESMVSRLMAIGRGAPTAVWPELAVFPDKMQGTLTLPAEWTTGYELQSIKLVVNSKIDTESPYCLPSDKPDLSTTSTDECTAWSGKLIYWGNHLSGDAQPGTTPPASVQNVVGWWSWQ